jgi:hypothetical protein
MEAAVQAGAARVRQARDVAQALPARWPDTVGEWSLVLQRLDALRQGRVVPRVEARWQEALAEMARQIRHQRETVTADRVPPLLGVLQYHAPRHPLTRAVEADVARARVERLVEESRWGEVVVHAHRSLQEHGPDDRLQRMALQAREARLQAWLALPEALQPDHAGAWLLEDAVILHEEGGTFDPPIEPEALFDRVFGAGVPSPPESLDSWVVVTESWHRMRPGPRTAALAARTHMLVAEAWWEHLGWWVDGQASRRIRRHTDAAAGYGWEEGVDALRRRVRWAEMLPLVVPAAMAGLLALLLALGAAPVRAWRAGGMIRDAGRLRRAGRPEESAACLARAVHLLETLLVRRWQDDERLAHACAALMLDALERGRPAEAVPWAERMLDLDEEHWPDGFAQLARRAGLTVPAPRSGP